MSGIPHVARSASAVTHVTKPKYPVTAMGKVVKRNDASLYHLVVHGFPRTATPADALRTLNKIGAPTKSILRLAGPPPVTGQAASTRPDPSRTPFPIYKSFHLTFSTSGEMEATRSAIRSGSQVYNVSAESVKRVRAQIDRRGIEENRNWLSSNEVPFDTRTWWLRNYRAAFPRDTRRDVEEVARSSENPGDAGRRPLPPNNITDNIAFSRITAVPNPSSTPSLTGRQVIIRGLPKPRVLAATPGMQNGLARGLLAGFRMDEMNPVRELPNYNNESTAIYLVSLPSVSEAYRLVRKLNCTDLELGGSGGLVARLRAEILW